MSLPAPMNDGVDMLRPIVQHTRSDVRAVRPDKRALFFINFSLPEPVQIPQGTKEGVGQDHREVGGAFGKSCQSLSGQLKYCSSRVGRQTEAQSLQLVKHRGQGGYQAGCLRVQ